MQSIASVFETHAKQIWGNCYKGQALVCEDKYVGDISKNGTELYKFEDESEFVERGNRPNPSDRKLILVLESPHKDEYRRKDEFGKVTPVPANGTTGQHIRTYIGKVLRCSTGTDCGTLQVILMNAVQYQCSQAHTLVCRANRLKRDDVFRNTFGEGEEFKQRLRELNISDRDTVINCCTKGTRTPYLRDLVGKAIKDVRGYPSQFVYFATCHPSVWFNKKLRAMRQVD